MLQKKYKVLAFFLLVFGVFCFISLNRHSVAKSFSYHSELWADKAGYNVYLPSLFIYNFNGFNLPPNLEKNTGHGFHVDSVNGKIITKYPYGVSLFQLPFWLSAHFLSSTQDGYSFLYQKSINVAGSFYLTAGLFFLFFSIRRFRSFNQSLLLSVVIILSTGIFYYGIFDTGMSHIYSFFCLSATLFLSKTLNEQNYKWNLLLLGIACVLYLIIRPVNIVFLIPILLYFYFTTDKSIRSFIFSGTFFLVMFVVCLIVFLPQLFYYKYAFGDYFTNSYQNEPFVTPNLNRVKTLLFGSDNGLLIYYPVLILLAVYYLVERDKISLWCLGLFFLYIIIYASWWSLSLGCGFGHRAFNDIAPFMFLPLILNKKMNKGIVAFIVLCCVINVKFIFSYDTCLYSLNPWDYSEYLSILFGEFK